MNTTRAPLDMPRFWMKNYYRSSAAGFRIRTTRGIMQFVVPPREEVVLLQRLGTEMICFDE